MVLSLLTRARETLKPPGWRIDFHSWIAPPGGDGRRDSAACLSNWWSFACTSATIKACKRTADDNYKKQQH
jgi:hypothetical protein